MKHTVILLFAFLAISANAQNFELGLIGGGALYSSALTHTTVLPVYAVSALKENKKWQYGVAFSYCHASYNYWQPTEIDQMYIAASTPTRIILSHADNSGKIFVNRKITTSRFVTYAGVFAGDILRRTKSINGDLLETTNTDLLSTGVQAGCTWHATKHIGINAEVAGAYYFAFSNAPNRQMVYPLTLGIRYRL